MLSAIERSGVPPETLEIEFTESTFMDVDAAMLGAIERLRALGVNFAIDDFGTGYSSLIMLSRLEADKLKIDRAFVHDMLQDQNNAPIVRATVSLAKSFGMTVAEGVEHEEQARFLRSIGCDMGQGFLFGRPMTPEEILERYCGQVPA